MKSYIRHGNTRKIRIITKSFPIPPRLFKYQYFLRQYTEEWDIASYKPLEFSPKVQPQDLTDYEHRVL